MRVDIETDNSELQLCAQLGERYGLLDEIGAGVLCELARALASGSDCVADPVEALRVWRALAEIGNAEAMADLGRHYLMAGDTDAARAWLTRAAEGGDTLARGLLISALSQTGSRADEVEAWGWVFDALQSSEPVERQYIRRHLPRLLADADPEIIEAARPIDRAFN